MSVYIVFETTQQRRPPTVDTPERSLPVAQLTSLPLVTQAEHSRPPLYKAAAGIYTDAREVIAPSAFRFTAGELARLMAYKAAIAAGLNTDQRGRGEPKA